MFSPSSGTEFNLVWFRLVLSDMWFRLVLSDMWFRLVLSGNVITDIMRFSLVLSDSVV